MRLHPITAILSMIAFLLVCLTQEPAEARGRRTYYGPVNYPAAPVVLYQPCMPVYAAPPMYAQQPYGYRPFDGPGYAPARPTTIVTVVTYDNYFEPKTVTVQPGTTVRWVNRGQHPHTATSNDRRWDSGDISPGASYSATFRYPGTYYYHCRHHTKDKMEGTIIVQSGGASSYGGSSPSRY